MIERELVAGVNTGTIVVPTGSASAIVARAWVDVRVAGGATVQVWFQRSADSDGPPSGAGPPWEATLRNAQRGYAEIPSGTEFLEYRIDARGPGGLTVELLAK